jgi:Ca-activated chloride channel family protein
VSRGDNFKRQAQAFRRKLMRPAATDLELKIEGLRVYDLEPAALPNLYHGAPVRLYGRYSGSGTGTVTLTANVQGQELAQSARMEFPASDETNPEIERMWAWKRIDSLMKKERTDRVVGEVIRLGETYSVVSEYTSFLVLENDAEYRRWKIERRNLDRMERDRAAQDSRSARLEAIRNRAVADLGPQPLLARNTAVQSKPAAGQPAAPDPQAPVAPATPKPASAPPRSQGFDLNIGTGPVGPLFVGLVWWMRRRKGQN